MASDQRDNEALMLAYGQGDVAAFNVLIDRHQRPVYNFLLRQVGNPALAEDLLQEVFLRVIRNAASYRREAKLTTWLYTIARNLCVDQSRRAKHRRAASLDAPLGGQNDSRARTMADVTADPNPGVERKVVGLRLQQRIHEAIEALPGEQREVFLMRETLGLQFKEIAQIVDCPENTVKSRMRYALAQMRRALEDYQDLARAAP